MYIQVCEVVEVVELGTFQSDDGIVMEVPAIGVDHVISTTALCIMYLCTAYCIG